MGDKTREELIRYIMTNLDDAVFVTDRHGRLLYFNPAAEALFSIGAGKPSGQKIWEYIPYVQANDGLIQLFIDAVGAKEQSRQALVEFEDNSGKRFRFRVSLSYQTEYDGLFLIIISDLTELSRVTDAFSRYTSPQIAEYVLHTPEGQARNGEYRDVTILMSDLRGFTAMSASMAAGPLVTMLNHYFEKMVSVIDSFGGTVIEFLGDGIFVVFGAPRNEPQHAARAVACGIEMQNAMPEVNRWNREQGFPELTMGIGISSGSCVVGNIGSEQKMKYGCVGETVNTAGRVEAQTVGRQVLVSEFTTALLPEPPAVRGQFSFLPKGVREPITVYDVSGYGAEHRLAAEAEVTWRDLERPEAVSWRLLTDDKSVEPGALEGEILAVSGDRRYLRLRAEPLPAFHRNLMFDLGAGLYGKVTGQEKGTAVVCLTAVPDCFEDWIKKLR